jgi:hypothetical protein
MKKLLILLCLCLTATLAKGQERKAFSPQKFQEELEAYITKEASLTSKEAEAFLPLFREMGTKQREVYRNMRKLGHDMPDSDEKCREIIKKRDCMDVKLKTIEQEYHNKFLEVVSPKKVFKIIKAEEKFYRGKLKGWSKGPNQRPPHQKR